MWVVRMGKPAGAVTFGDFVDAFVASIWKAGTKFQRIDIVFDSYILNSSKGNTRARRARTAKPIRRVIENRGVPLLKIGKTFFARKKLLCQFSFRRALLLVASEMNMKQGQTTPRLTYSL